MTLRQGPFCATHSLHDVRVCMGGGEQSRAAAGWGGHPPPAKRAQPLLFVQVTADIRLVRAHRAISCRAHHARYDVGSWSYRHGAAKSQHAKQERLIFSRRRSKPARLKFKRAREELITLNQPVLGSSPRGLTSNSGSIFRTAVLRRSGGFWCLTPYLTRYRPIVHYRRHDDRASGRPSTVRRTTCSTEAPNPQDHGPGGVDSNPPKSR